MKVGIEVKPYELKIGAVVDINYIRWHFDCHYNSKAFPTKETHPLFFNKYLFHHTLKGFELIDDNYTR